MKCPEVDGSIFRVQNHRDAWSSDETNTTERCPEVLLPRCDMSLWSIEWRFDAVCDHPSSRGYKNMRLQAHHHETDINDWFKDTLSVFGSDPAAML